MRLLVIRTSAMGDVALSTPVLRAVSQQYPDTEIVMVTRPAFKPFFYSIGGLTLFFTDIRKRHKGLTGLMRLFRDISATGRFDAIIDLHDVLRSKVLRLLFRLKGVPSFVIDKGRGEKRSVISGKIRSRLKHSVLRYSDTFRRAGFPLSLTDGPWIIPTPAALAKIDALTGSQNELKIGVAPYARHKLKMWPEEYMVRLLGMIAEKYGARFYLFGGNEESEKLAALRRVVRDSVNTSGTLSLDEEIALMSRLDMMIAMDSSNMHMAALSGAKVISVWGGTDPISGFGAWMQPDDHFMSIPVEDLTCRPCTIFGKGECARGDLACMNWLTPQMVFRKIESLGIFPLPPEDTV
jgi:ADP-heptose:LPS heptosyltransferase